MMNEKQVEALKLAREALKLNCSSQTESPATKALAAIREALASKAEQPAQVDPCIDGSCSCCWTHLDEQPASKPWVGLSTDEMKEISDRYHLKPPNVPVAFRAIEAKLKEKNNGTR